ncbi:MAG: carboxylesterase family protein [Gammaproteobacteria bacterium]|nr:carboxylesterase family protein [Gammaproteobacteria bacterium]
MKKHSYLSVSAILLLVYSIFSFAGDRPSTDTVVPTRSGLVQGTLVEEFDVIAYKGIPYARPPTGDLRWKAPQDPESWEGIRDASEFGSRCHQGRGGSEDCLYLNVWQPQSQYQGHDDDDDDERDDDDHRLLPVFFYIHGGSNTGGSGDGSWYTVAKNYNALVVSINYRVGVMGWFSHPSLKTDNRIDDSGNYGLLDQVKALQWVKRNIRRFGGDPRNVTIAGASAGAQNVSYLMHTPLAKNLFHKAIMESNYPGIRPVAAATKSSKQALYNLLVGDGLAVDTPAAKTLADGMSNDEIRDYLYGKTAAEIRDVYWNGYWGSINWGDFYRDDIVSGNAWVPPPMVQKSANRPEFVYTIGDGYVLPDNISFADFSNGNGFPKPTVIGTTKNENNAWNAYWPYNFEQGKSLETLVDEAINDGGPSWLLDFLATMGDSPAEFMANYKFGTELIDELNNYLGAQNLARNLSQAKPRIPVYVYRFDWGSDANKEYKIPFEDAWKFYVGAPHVAEADFFWQRFEGLADGGTVENGYQYTADNFDGRLKLSHAARAYLNEFIHNRSGKIRHSKEQPVKWKRWKKNRERMIVFDADYDTLDVHMDSDDINRTPQELYEAHLAHPNENVRDFIEYYVMWSWHYNWYPNRSNQADPFDTSPGPNAVFDPLDP